MKLIQIFLLSLFITGFICGQEIDIYETKGFLNGRSWKIMDEGEKYAGVMMMYNSGRQIYEYLLLSLKSEVKNSITEGIMNSYTVEDYGPGEFVEELDKIYSNGDYMSVPIVLSYNLICKKFNGDISSEQLYANLNALKLVYARN